MDFRHPPGYILIEMREPTKAKNGKLILMIGLAAAAIICGVLFRLRTNQAASGESVRLPNSPAQTANVGRISPRTEEEKQTDPIGADAHLSKDAASPPVNAIAAASVAPPRAGAERPEEEALASSAADLQNGSPPAASTVPVVRRAVIRPVPELPAEVNRNQTVEIPPTRSRRSSP